MDPTLILIVGGGLALLFLVVGVVLSLVGGGSVVEERLGRYAETGGLVTTIGDEELSGDEQTSALSDFLNNLGEGTDLFAKISTNLAQADIKLRPAEYLAARVIALFVVGAIAFVLSGFILAVVGAIVGFFKASTDPQAVVRIYLDGSAKPIIEELLDYCIRYVGTLF